MGAPWASSTSTICCAPASFSGHDVSSRAYILRAGRQRKASMCSSSAAAFTAPRSPATPPAGASRSCSPRRATMRRATSSASSKLIHGGLRYLEQLELGLVRESLIERGQLLKTAPHLVAPLRFLVPHLSLAEAPGPHGKAGLEALRPVVLRHGLPPSGRLGPSEIAMLPRLRQEASARSSTTTIAKPTMRGSPLPCCSMRAPAAPISRTAAP